ncbi:MAG: PIG-L deacetylase family protein [Phycisphaerae bacterium]
MAALHGRNVALSFLAHPDDAEILCAGTLARLAALGWEIHIATATPGDCGTMTQTRWDISATRTQEARRAAALIGATYHCLDERDGLVCYAPAAIQKATDLFRRIAPSLVFTHAQDDYMMDHVEVSKLARAASFVYGAPNISAHPLREGSAVPAMYYCDPIEGVDSLGRRAVPTTIVDVSAVHARKLEMLACHASQREWLRAHHGMDEYLDAVRRHDAGRGAEIGAKFAEGFVQHRGHAYPRADVLGELLR